MAGEKTTAADLTDLTAMLKQFARDLAALDPVAPMYEHEPGDVAGQEHTHG